jgi:hypothetical protein
MSWNDLWRLSFAIGVTGGVRLDVGICARRVGSDVCSDSWYGGFAIAVYAQWGSDMGNFRRAETRFIWGSEEGPRQAKDSSQIALISAPLVKR